MENQEKQETKHKRRVRYSGTHPKTFKEKYKEMQPEKLKSRHCVKNTVLKILLHKKIWDKTKRSCLRKIAILQKTALLLIRFYLLNG